MLFFYTLTSGVLFSSIARPNTVLKNSYISRFYIIMFTCLIALIIPFRNIYPVGSDMSLYIGNLQFIHNLSLIQTYKVSIWEPLFVFIQWVISRFTTDPTVYLIVTLLLYISILHKAIKNVFLPWQQLFIFFAYFNFTFFYGYIFNGARQGFSMMFILLAISYWFKDSNNIKIYLAGCAATLCHYSSIPVVISLIIIQKFKIKLKSIIILWSFSALLFITGLNRYLLYVPFIAKIHFVENYSSSESLYYFAGQTNYKKFLIFSAIFLFLFLLFYKFITMDDVNKKRYLNLIKCYSIFNTYFLLFGFIAFSNRVASFSWFLIPVLFMYPFLYKQKHSPLLLFTMTIVVAIIGYFTGLDYLKGV